MIRKLRNTSIWIRLARITSFRWQIPLLHRFIPESTNLVILILRKLDRKAMKSSSALTGFVEMRMSHIAYRGWLQGSANVFVFTTQSTNHRYHRSSLKRLSSQVKSVPEDTSLAGLHLMWHFYVLTDLHFCPAVPWTSNPLHCCDSFAVSACCDW